MGRSTVVGFCCNECAYAAADLAGSTHRTHPSNVLVVRIPCSGIVDPAWLLYSLARGADAVFVAGCRKGECHYVDGNFKAEKRVQFVKEILEAVGIEPERVEMFFMASSEPHKFVAAAEEMASRAERLGPLERRSVERDGKKVTLARALAAIAREIRDVELPEIPGFQVPVFSEECVACGACVEACPEGALRISESDAKRRIELSARLCTGCGACIEACNELEKALTLGGVRVRELLEEWVVKVERPLVRCEVCGRPFATEGELSRAGAPRVCPSCKERLSAGAIAMGRVRR